MCYVSPSVILPAGHAVTQGNSDSTSFKKLSQKTEAENLHPWLMQLFFWIYKCVILW